MAVVYVLFQASHVQIYFFMYALFVHNNKKQRAKEPQALLNAHTQCAPKYLCLNHLAYLWNKVNTERLIKHLFIFVFAFLE